MPHLFKLIAGLAIALTAAPAMAQNTYPAVDDAARLLSQELRVYAACHLGQAPEVGIWPLESDTLPIADSSAEAFYETVFAALNANKPDCVTFIDGDGASGVIRHFIQVGTGAEARERVDNSFRDVAYIVGLDLFDRGGRVLASLKLSDAAGKTIAAAPAFDVPEDFVGGTCAAGAVPLERGLKTAARKLLEAAPDMEALIDRGGRFGGPGEVPDFTSYFSGLAVAALIQEATDVLSGRSVRQVGEDQFGAAGTYAFSFQYWPCADGQASDTLLSLRGGDGQSASWHGKMRLDRIPAWIPIFPDGTRGARAEADTAPGEDEGAKTGEETGEEPGEVSGEDTGLGSDDVSDANTDAGKGAGKGDAPDPEPAPEPAPEPTMNEPAEDPDTGDAVETPPAYYALSIEPRAMMVGDVARITANVAAGCDPFFLDITEGGNVAPLPRDEVLLTEPRPDGGTRFRSDASTPYGLKVTEADPKGTHYLGFICTPGGAVPDGPLLEEIFNGFADGRLTRTDPDAGPVYRFERYTIH